MRHSIYDTKTGEILTIISGDLGLALANCPPGHDVSEDETPDCDECGIIVDPKTGLHRTKTAEELAAFEARERSIQESVETAHRQNAAVIRAAVDLLAAEGRTGDALQVAADWRIPEGIDPRLDAALASLQNDDRRQALADITGETL